MNPDGNKLLHFSGRWDDSLSHYKNDPDSLQIIWRMKPMPSHFADMYGFTAFAVELNGEIIWFKDRINS
jgi:hypothetical protein